MALAPPCSYTKERVVAFRSAFDLLTLRERQVVSHVAAGLTGKEVARRLGISPKTVDAHRTRVFAKLGVRGAVELAGLLNSPPPSASNSTSNEKAAQRPVDESASILALPGAVLHVVSATSMAGAIRRITYRRQPVDDEVNVFMMWDSAGNTAGYILAPRHVEVEIVRLELPLPGVVRPLANAICYGLYLALAQGLALCMTGDPLVWDATFGPGPQ